MLLRQLRLGHRSGTDAALVIAAARPDARGRIADLGAGSGAIGLSLAVLEPSLEVTLIELDAEIAALAAESAALNGCAERVRSLTANVEELAHSPRSRRELGAPYDLVVTNPPFTNARASQTSPDPAPRAGALRAREGALARWIDAAHFLLKPKGVLIVDLPAGRDGGRLGGASPEIFRSRDSPGACARRGRGDAHSHPRPKGRPCAAHASAASRASRKGRELHPARARPSTAARPSSAFCRTGPAPTLKLSPDRHGQTRTRA